MAGLTKADKTKRIDRLRLQYNRLYEGQIGSRYPVNESGRTELSQMIQQDMAEIIQKELLKDRRDWATLCQEHMARENYTYEELARIIDVTRRALEDQEHRETSLAKKIPKGKNMEDFIQETGYFDINPFYLEAYSLVFQKSPYQLLGENFDYDDLFVLEPLETSPVYYYGIIMKYWFDPHDAERRSVLKKIVNLGRITKSYYEKFADFLKSITVAQKISDIDPLDSKYLLEFQNDENDEYGFHRNPYTDWTKYSKLFQKPLEWRKGIKKTEEYRIRYLFWEALSVFHDLSERDPVRLRFLAQIAVAPPEVLAAACDISKAMFRCLDSKSFRVYDVDSHIFSEEDIKEHKMISNRKRMRKIDPLEMKRNEKPFVENTQKEDKSPDSQ